MGMDGLNWTRHILHLHDIERQTPQVSASDFMDVDAIADSPTMRVDHKVAETGTKRAFDDHLEPALSIALKYQLLKSPVIDED